MIAIALIDELGSRTDSQPIDKPVAVRFVTIVTCSLSAYHRGVVVFRLSRDGIYTSDKSIMILVNSAAIFHDTDVHAIPTNSGVV